MAALWTRFVLPLPAHARRAAPARLAPRGASIAPVRIVLVALLLAVLAPMAAAAVPTPAQVKAAWRPSDARLLDRHGEALDVLRVDMSARRQSWVALADISPSLGRAVMQAEDQRFMEHGGIDLRAVGQAAWDNLFRGQRRTRGASTITMQLAGLLDPGLGARAAGRSWARKWDQALAARELEAGWTKPQILEAYLNLASFRGELQGIGAAARGLFGKVPSGLDAGESAILASLLRAPSAPRQLVARRACALARELAQAGQGAADCAAIEWQVGVALERSAAAAVPSPLARRLLDKNRPLVRSSLDAGLQRFAAGALRRQLAELAERNVGDGALVVLDNASGEVLAWVANDGAGEVDGVTALRQAGSTLKPFLYELAIERGQLTAASLLDDSPVGIPTVGGLYVPRNYDHAYRELASVRTSLASSLNVPAVRTLMLAGLERFHGRLRALGLDSLDEDPDFYGYSLALGSADVSLLGLANAYRTLANGGLRTGVALAPRAAAAPVQRVLDARAAFIVADILSDRAARSTTFGLRNELATGFWSAVKTGTSKDMRDNWCIGFSDRYTVAVWVGNFDGRPMWDVSGVAGAAPVWRDVMDYLHRDRPSRAPEPPDGLVRRSVAFVPAIEPPRAEWFVGGTETARVEALAPSQRLPKILYPAPGTIALDPDIPAGLQRVGLRAQAGKGLRWRMDDVELGPADRDVAWTPVAGAHVLALVGGEGRSVDEVRFEVRGEVRGIAP